MSYNYRVVEHVKGNRVWYTAEKRFLWIFWRSLRRRDTLNWGIPSPDPWEYESLEVAKRAIEIHKVASKRVEKEVVWLA